MRNVLLASLPLALLAFPLAATASVPATITLKTRPAFRITREDNPVRVVHAAVIELPDSMAANQIPNDATLVFSMDVNRKGEARDVHLVQSEDAFLDVPVLSAIRYFRFSPEHLEDRPLSAPIQLTVVVHH